MTWVTAGHIDQRHPVVEWVVCPQIHKFSTRHREGVLEWSSWGGHNRFDIVEAFVGRADVSWPASAALSR